MTLVQLNDAVTQRLSAIQKQVSTSKKTMDLTNYLDDSKNTIVGLHPLFLYS